MNTPPLEMLLHEYQLSFAWDDACKIWWLADKAAQGLASLSLPFSAKDLEQARTEAAEYILSEYPQG